MSQYIKQCGCDEDEWCDKCHPPKASAECLECRRWKAEIERLKDDLHHAREVVNEQTREVVAAMGRAGAIPGTINPYGHPVEQVVGTVCRLLIEEAKEREEAARQLYSLVISQPMPTWQFKDINERWPWLLEEE